MTNKRLENTVVGVISDTHGHLSAHLPEIFKAVDVIIHAGDIDNPDTFNALKSLAPVIAVRGNMDRGNWSKGLLKSEFIEIGQVSVYVVHDIDDLDIDPESIKVKVVISGHTHRPAISNKSGVLYVNPGSASSPRDGNPPTVAILNITDGSVKSRLVSIPG